MKTKLLLLIMYGCLCHSQGAGQDLARTAEQQPVAVRGTLDIRGIAYTSKGMTPRRSPFSWVISGNPTLSLYGIDIPVSFTFTEQERSFGQPFNQLGLSPTYKWVTLHAGYRNVTFSPYTLAGHTMLGGGLELKPGKFRIGVMTGRLNRATTVDTTTGALHPYSFSRYGTAVKVGYGTDESHVELSLLSARDSEKGFKGHPDSSSLRPAANLVLGADVKHRFRKGFYVFADGGLSIYTDDRRYDLTIDVDSVYTKLKPVSRLVGLNVTSEYFLAYSGGVGYTHKFFSVKLAYRHVDPGFRSMGAYFFQNDLQHITVSPSFNALKGRLRFTGSAGIQRDNRKKLKATTTRRLIALANLSWDITDKLGIDANYTNFTSNSQPAVTMIENRYLLTQTNSNLSVTPRFVLARPATTQTVVLSYNSSSLRDLNEDTKATNDIRSLVAFLNYNLTLNRLGLSVTSGLNYTANLLSVGNMRNQGVTLGLSKAFLKNKLMVSTSNSYIMTDVVQGHGTILNLGGNVTCIPMKGHRIGLRVSAMRNEMKREDADPLRYSELTGEIGYTYSF